MPKRIIVLGMMRSGTSLTAELIRRWGAYAGAENDLWKSDVNDPRGYGYMEYKPLQDLNDELLNNNDRVPTPNDILEQKAVEPVSNQKAQDLLHNMDEETVKNHSAAWVWKDARLPLTLPFWVKLWGDPIFVITVRHPIEVVLSSAKTEEIDQDNLPLSAGFIYWQYCMLNILSFTEGSHRKIFITYDQLIQNPEQECARLSRFLDEQCEKSIGDTQKRMDSMLSQVTKKQRHHSVGKSLAETEQATREQRALYNFLRVKTIYPDEAFNNDDFALYPGWMEHLQAMDMLVSLSAQN